jgi:NAD(P)H dehydrogenase (quinone)
MKMAIVVASQTGRTARMGEAAAEGARAAGAEVRLLRAEDALPSDLEAADAVMLGTGVHMGGMASTMRAFFERAAPLWLQGALIGKVGAAFVSAGAGARGGAELTLIALLANLAEHGMLLVPMHNRLEGFASAGCHWGPVAWTNPRQGQAGPTPEHLAACRSHGQWVAECTQRMRNPSQSLGSRDG